MQICYNTQTKENMNHKIEFLNKCMIIDTETTSKDWKIAEIIEAGFCIREEDSWAVFQELHKPVKTVIPAEIEALCYITNDMVKSALHFRDSSEVFQTVVNSYVDGYLIAHNNFYDMKVLEQNGVSTTVHTWIDTLELAKRVFNTMKDIEALNLPYLRFKLKLDIPIEVRCHRAGNDCLITGKLLEYLIELMEGLELIDISKSYGPQLIEYLKGVIIYDTFPFGKHKGKKFSEIPIGYWTWAMNNTEWFNEESETYDPNLAASISLALEQQM